MNSLNYIDKLLMSKAFKRFFLLFVNVSIFFEYLLEREEKVITLKVIIKTIQ